MNTIRLIPRSLTVRVLYSGATPGLRCRRGMAGVVGAPPHCETISDAIKEDHRALEKYYRNIIDADEEDTDTRVRWQHQMVWGLARHTVGEELVLYPAFEDYLTLAIAKKDRAAHEDLKTQLKAFQGLFPTDLNFTPTLESLMIRLRDHIKEEEDHDLVLLEAELSKHEGITKSLAKSFERTKWLVPTRSHPNAPHRPPWETVAALLAAPIDKVRDVFLRFPKEDTPGEK